MKTSFTLPALALLLLACGSTSLEPVENGPGAAGGTASASPGENGAAAGDGGGSNAPGGAGGTGERKCSTNPAGCKLTGCPQGQVCSFETTDCVPSACAACDPETGEWACTLDCGGGACVPEAEADAYSVRVGIWPGTKAIADICVAYENPNLSNAWEQSGIFEKLDLDANDANLSLQKNLTRYLPLSGKPIAFGLRGPDGVCAEPQQVLPVTPTSHRLTLLAVPFAGETKLWYLNDVDGGAKPGVRVVNATAPNHPLSVTNYTDAPISLGVLPFGNAPDYAPVNGTSIKTTLVVDGQKSYMATWRGPDALSTEATTIFLLGTPNGDVLSTPDGFALGCDDQLSSSSISVCQKADLWPLLD